MTAPWLVPVGGFLGAGKTTLILAAARLLAQRGIRTAAILNDQGEELVDTALVQRDLHAEQVSGGCFCCRFTDLLAAADRLRVHAPEVIFAEPVGSCTDLAATILRPLRADFPHRFRLAPLTVVIDLAQDHTRNEDLAFLFRHQIAEADLLCYSKSDLGRIPRGLASELPVFVTSARTGEGVADWLDAVLSQKQSAGERPLSIDYQRYAEAEAALAWLNRRLQIRLSAALSPAAFAGPLFDDLIERLRAAGIAVVHAKLIDQAPTGYVKVAWTGTDIEPQAEGTLDASPAHEHDLLLNLRALGDPAEVQRIVDAAIAALPGHRMQDTGASFRPSPPQPERRLTS